MGVSVEAGERESLVMMRLLHLMDAASSGRDTMELDLRARRVVQVLGLAGATPIAMVSQRLGVSPSTMTGLADRLERQGYVRRRAHATDRRSTVLELTVKGKRLFAREKDFYRRLIDELISPLADPERKLILQAFRELPVTREEPAPSSA